MYVIMYVMGNLMRIVQVHFTFLRYYLTVLRILPPPPPLITFYLPEVFCRIVLMELYWIVSTSACNLHFYCVTVGLD